MDEEYMAAVRNRLATAVAQELVPVMIDMVRRTTDKGGCCNELPPAVAVARCLRELASQLER